MKVSAEKAPAEAPTPAKRLLGVTRGFARMRNPKPLGHAGANQSETRKDTEKCEGSRIHHNLVVNADIKGAVRTRLERDVDAKILSKHGRRPGGLDCCDSVHAPLDRDFSHYSSRDSIAALQLSVCAP